MKYNHINIWKYLKNVVVANHAPCTIFSWPQIELLQVFVAELIVTRRIFKTELSGVADCHPYSRWHTVHKDTHLVMLTNMRTLVDMLILITSLPTLEVNIELNFPIWPYQGVEDNVPSELKICLLLQK